MRAHKVTSTLKLMAGLASALTLVACELPTPQQATDAVDGEEGSSFYFSSARAEFTKETKHHPKIQIPMERELSFKVCLVDQNRGRSIVSHRFEIRGGATDQTQVTDGNGCLIWQENLPFSFLSSEKLVTLRREIVARGVQKGQKSFDLAVNPWSEVVYSQIDSRVKDLVPLAQSEAALKGEGDKTASLWLDMVRVNLLQEQVRDGEGQYKVELAGSVQGDRKGLNGERRFFDISGGQVSAQVTLICAVHPQGQKPRYTVLSKVDRMSGSFVGAGRLSLTGKLKISKFCPNSGYNMAAVELQVDSSDSPVLPFRGLFHLGPAQNLGGMAFTLADGDFSKAFIENRNYTIEQYLGQDLQVNASQGSTKDPSDPLDLLQTYRVEVGRLDFANRASSARPAQKTRERSFTVTACFRQNIDQTPLRGITIEIQRINGTSLKGPQTRTLNDGCISFEDSITYNHFSQECWFEKELSFKNNDLGVNQTLKVLVNPWSTSGNWAQDVRYAAGTQANSCARGDSLIMLDSYSMDATAGRYRYSVDEYLNLQLHRETQISLNPRLVRPSFSAAQGSFSAPEPLPVGRYLLRYALVDQSVRDLNEVANAKGRVYSVGRSIMKVREDGQVVDNLRISLNAEHFISLGLLNQFVIEILPLKEGTPESLSNSDLESLVDKDHNIKLSPFVAQFVARSEGGSLRRLDSWLGRSLVLELEKIYQQDQQALRQFQAQYSNKAMHARATNLEHIQLDQGSVAQSFMTRLGNAGPQLGALPNRNTRPAFTEAQLQAIIQSGSLSTNDVVQFCGYFFKHFWTQKLPGKNHSFMQIRDEADKNAKIFLLTRDCVMAARDQLKSAFDIEFKYFVKKPTIISSERDCSASANFDSRCNSDGAAPAQVLIRSLSVGHNFSMGRDFAFTRTGNFNMGVNAGISKIVGISGGMGYSMSKSTSESQSNSVTVSQGQRFVTESLNFRLRAEEAEKCLAIRLAPTLFEKEQKRLWFWNEKSYFAEALHPELSETERQWGQKRGILLCASQLKKANFEFTESYHLVRPDGETGLLGDERSRAKVDGLFLSMRGLNDFTSFLTFVNQGLEVPPHYKADMDARGLDLGRSREALQRGSRAAPGVFSSTPK